MSNNILKLSSVFRLAAEATSYDSSIVGLEERINSSVPYGAPCKYKITLKQPVKGTYELMRAIIPHTAAPISTAHVAYSLVRNGVLKTNFSGSTVYEDGETESFISLDVGDYYYEHDIRLALGAKLNSSVPTLKHTFEFDETIKRIIMIVEFSDPTDAGGRNADYIGKDLKYFSKHDSNNGVFSTSSTTTSSISPLLGILETITIRLDSNTSVVTRVFDYSVNFAVPQFYNILLTDLSGDTPIKLQQGIDSVGRSYTFFIPINCNNFGTVDYVPGVRSQRQLINFRTPVNKLSVELFGDSGQLLLGSSDHVLLLKAVQ